MYFFEFFDHELFPFLRLSRVLGEGLEYSGWRENFKGLFYFLFFACGSGFHGLCCEFVLDVRFCGSEACLSPLSILS